MASRSKPLRRVVTVIALTLPLVVWAGLFISSELTVRSLEAEMAPADGVVWGTGADQVVVHVAEHPLGDLVEHDIHIDRGATSLADYKVTIDWDMYGGGFVAAMQADDDPPLEIVAWGKGTSLIGTESFYLDFVPSPAASVQVVDFEAAPPELRDLAERWYTATVKGGLTVSLGLVMMVLVYLIIGVGLLVRRRRSTTKGR